MAVQEFNTIKTKEQYQQYAGLLKGLIFAPGKTKEMNDDIDVLTALIEEWDASHNTFVELDPVAILKSLMEERKMTAAQLGNILKLQEELVSDLLNYRSRFSRQSIVTLSEYFKLDQTAFDRDYKLNSPR